MSCSPLHTPKRFFKLQFYPKSIFHGMPWKVLHFLFSSRTVRQPYPLDLGIYFGLCKSHMFSFDEVIRIVSFQALGYTSFRKIDLSVICQRQRQGCCLMSAHKWTGHALRPCRCTFQTPPTYPPGYPQSKAASFFQVRPIPLFSMMNGFPDSRFMILALFSE